MEYLEYKKTAIPKLGIGTWQCQGKECTEAVCTALKVGYRHIDTAQIYGNEVEVGLGIKESLVDRDKIFLVTKVWRDVLSFNEVLKSTEISLKKLKTNYIDLLLIHWPNSDFPLKETLAAFVKLVEQKKTRFVGLSNFPSKLIEEAKLLASDLICNQVEYHPFLSQEKVLTSLRKNNMFLTAYCPLARRRVFKNHTLKKIAEKHNKTCSQVALRWLLSQTSVVAIPKSSNRKHIEENFHIFDFKLSKEDMRLIDSQHKTQRLISPDFAPEWDSIEL